MVDGSPSAGWREVADEMGVEAGLGEYVEENREDLEALAEEDYPVSPVIKTLLTRVERGAV
ncbi:hypothetical protein [Halorubrum sp. DTA98]|uniref:hypothetical protein n=1 Tax=Halorubrum sp. DTA98 TaxID=3402163 RepID=UPI003AB02F5A